MGIGRVELPFIGVLGIQVSGSGVFDYLVSAELICYSSEYQISRYQALIVLFGFLGIDYCFFPEVRCLIRMEPGFDFDICFDVEFKAYND